MIFKLKKIIYFVIILSICSLITLDSREQGDFVRDISIKELKFDIPKIRKESLGKGITFYSLNQGEFPITYLEIDLYGGESILGERPIEISEIIADMLKYGGTKNLPEENFSAKLESLGGTFSVTSEYEKIILKFSWLTRDEKEVLTLISELFSSALLGDNTFENSKRKVKESIARRNERTEAIAFRKVKEILYRDTIEGKTFSLESLEKIKKEDVVSFWNKEILRSCCRTVLASGMYNEANVKKTLTEIFTEPDLKITPQTIENNKLVSSYKSYSNPKVFVKKKVNQSMIIFYSTLTKHNSPEFFSIQLLNYILGGSGFNSYLMKEIRVARGLAYTTTSYPVFKEDHGVFYAYTLTKNETLKEAHQIMTEVFSDKTFDKITEEELADAKNAISNQFVFLFSNKQRILENQLRFDEHHLPADYLDNYRRNIQSVTLSDLKNIGRKYFRYTDMKTLIVSSEENLQKQFPGEGFIIEPEDKILR